jgi:hypothetical protein
LNQRISINGEVAVDVVNVSQRASDLSSESILQISVAPLVHLPVGSSVLVAGPKVGIKRSWSSGSARLQGMTFDVDVDSFGWLVGANLGGFVGIYKRMAVGGLFNFDYQNLISCSSTLTNQSPAVPIQNGPCMPSGPGAKILSATAALLF